MQLVVISMPPMTLSQKKSARHGKRWQRKPCVWMSSRLRLSNSVGKETAVNPCPMNSFRFAGAYVVRRLVVPEIMENALRMAEEQLRAVCPVSKSIPYVSYEAVMYKREQRRKSLEFSVLMNW